MTYPTARRDDTVESYAGRSIAEPYRWMEDLDSPEVQKWVDAENAVTFGYLERLPQREAIRKRLTELWNFPRTDAPEREAGKLYFRRNSGLQKQAVLFSIIAPGAPPREVLDPNQLSPDGSVAVPDWKVSPDGRWLAYTTAPGGSDLQDIHVRDLRKGRDLAQVVRWTKFSNLSWTRDSKGFLYNRYKGTEKGAVFSGANTVHQVWYHPVAAAQRDRLIFERPQNPKDYVVGQVSVDGRWLFLLSAITTSNNRLWLADLRSAAAPRLSAKPLPIAIEEDAKYVPLGVHRGKLYLHTTFEAPNGRIVALMPGDTHRSRWRTIIKESESPILDDGALLVNGRIVLARLKDVQTQVSIFDAQGKPQEDVQLPEPGSVFQLRGKNQDDDFFFVFTSYLRPRSVYRYSLGRRRLEPFEPPASPFDASAYETRSLFYASKDGTRVPLFVTLRNGTALDGSHPALMYAYGGFNFAMQPAYSPSVATWLERGGVYAVANVRGGSEYGEAWHHAGMREKKQTVFNDFIAAAEYLQHEGYTNSGRLAIRGVSNGGLLVGAVMTQRPDLFAVALPMVGVMDMLRFQKFTGGALWVDEYGSSDDAAAVSWLLDYSPLHNLKSGNCYPATLVTTADRDDRVVPSHSFKFAATLQSAQG